jgi:hypothetical protein
LMPALLNVENWVSLKPALAAMGMLHLFITPHVQTQSNRVCDFHVILLWLMLPRDHFVSSFLGPRVVFSFIAHTFFNLGTKRHFLRRFKSEQKVPWKSPKRQKRHICGRFKII